MTAVFVHGVPETAQIWDGLRDALPGKSAALALPGFGTARPAGFTATKDAYASWLAERLAPIAAADGPVDLVGHDWGAILTLRVASTHGHLLRSWAVDVANCLHPDYAWHPVAQLWQRPGEGEQWWERMREAPGDSPESGASRLAAFGVPADLAAAVAAANDTVMTGAILDLYRSAAPNAAADWGARLPAAADVPGLVVVPADDPLNDPARSAEVADLLRARVERLPGLRHAWMAQDPAAGAAVLRAFWSGLPQ